MSHTKSIMLSRSSISHSAYSLYNSPTTMLRQHTADAVVERCSCNHWPVVSYAAAHVLLLGKNMAKITTQLT